MGLNAYQGRAIYDKLLTYREFPETLFTGSPTQRLRLRDALGNP